jgi:hypothetical protein
MYVCTPSSSDAVSSNSIGASRSSTSWSFARNARALGEVLAQSRLRLRDVERHRVERAAQPAELVGSLQVAARREVSRGDLFRRSHEPRRAPREQEMEHEPHREREHRHPARPVERLLDDLGARLGLVPLQVVGEEQAAGARRAQLLAAATEQDAGVTEQLVSVRVDADSRAALANGARRLIEIELLRHVGELASEPRTARRGDDGVVVVGQRGERDVVVVREHGDLVLRGREVALQQQVFERALQPRHLLREPLAAILLRPALRLRNVVEQVHRAQHGGEREQDQRDRELERRLDAEGHQGRPAAVTSGVRRAAQARARFRCRGSCAAASRRPSAP